MVPLKRGLKVKVKGAGNSAHDSHPLGSELRCIDFILESWQDKNI